MNNNEILKKCNFYDNLKTEHVSDEAYDRGKMVWKTLKCKTLQDYVLLGFKKQMC